MNKIKDILKRMKQTLDMYRLLKVTKKSIKSVDKHLRDANFPREGRRHIFWLSSSYIKGEMRRRYLWLRYSYSQIEDIYDDALANEFIESRLIEDREIIPDGKLLSDKPIEQLRITRKGRELLDRALWIIPIGLYYAWFKEYGRFFAGAGVGGVVILIGKTFIDWILPFIIERIR